MEVFSFEMCKICVLSLFFANFVLVYAYCFLLIILSLDHPHPAYARLLTALHELLPSFILVNVNSFLLVTSPIVISLVTLKVCLHTLLRTAITEASQYAHWVKYVHVVSYCFDLALLVHALVF